MAVKWILMMLSTLWYVDAGDIPINLGKDLYVEFYLKTNMVNGTLFKMISSGSSVSIKATKNKKEKGNYVYIVKNKWMRFDLFVISSYAEITDWVLNGKKYRFRNKLQQIRIIDSKPNTYYCLKNIKTNNKKYHLNLLKERKCPSSNCSCTNGKCVFDSISYTFKCNCNNEYIQVGNGCQLRKCQKPCSDKRPCKRYRNGTEQCVCEGVFTGSHCSCYKGYCHNYGKCNDEKGYKVCKCLKNFFGKRCKCTKNYCSKAGSCSETDASPTCYCESDHFGNNCQCSNSYCNNGYCKPSAKSNKKSCKCKKGFTGDKCEYNNNLCSNRGDIYSSDKQLKCFCHYGYFGKTCACSKSLCNNHGNCSELNSKPKCKCVKNYSGKRCQCPDNYCKNNGTCLETLRNPTCSCVNGYYGNKCNCHSKYCNNNGKCFAQKNKYYCRCKDDYCGSYCRCKKSQCTNGGVCKYDEVTKKCSCSCRKHFYGDNCFCNSRICLNGGICKNNDKSNNYTCICPYLFKGEHCEIRASSWEIMQLIIKHIILIYLVLSASIFLLICCGTYRTIVKEVRDTNDDLSLTEREDSSLYLSEGSVASLIDDNEFQNLDDLFFNISQKAKTVPVLKQYSFKAAEIEPRKGSSERIDIIEKPKDETFVPKSVLKTPINYYDSKYKVTVPKKIQIRVEDAEKEKREILTNNCHTS